MNNRRTAVDIVTDQDINLAVADDLFALLGQMIFSQTGKGDDRAKKDNGLK